MDGVKVHYFASGVGRRLYYSPSMATYLDNTISDFDLVHTHSIFLWPTWHAARRAKSDNVPYIVSPRGMLVEDLIAAKSPVLKRSWIRLIERKNLMEASSIHFTSSAERSEAGQVLGSSLDGFVLENGTDVSDHASMQQDRVPPTDGYVLFIGRINWKKGLDRLISSLVEMPEVRLIIAGNDEEGYREKLNAIASKAKVVGQIEYSGFVSGAAKTELIQGARMLVLPSYNENFGNVVLEALAEGCPVVVTPEVGAAEIVRASGGGLVTGDSGMTLVDGISRLNNDNDLWQRCSKQGADYVRENCSWDSVARRMLEQYQGIVAES